MTNFALIFLSPFIVAAFTMIAVGITRVAKLNRPSGKELLRFSVIFGAIGAGIALIHTIAWMIWYEFTSGYSAGNAPIFWIFVSGPSCFAAGEVVALVSWWFKFPRRIWGMV